MPDDQRIVFINGAVFDGSGAPPVPADVIVRGSVIESVLAGGGTERAQATRWSTARG